MDYSRILDIAQQLKLPQNDIDSITEYLEHNEWGISFEVLCSAIEAEGIVISRDDYKEIEAMGLSMGMDNELWCSILIK